MHGPEKRPKPDWTRLVATGPLVAVAYFGHPVELPVAEFSKYLKTVQKPVAIGCNWFLCTYEKM